MIYFVCLFFFDRPNVKREKGSTVADLIFHLWVFVHEDHSKKKPKKRKKKDTILVYKDKKGNLFWRRS